MMGRRPPHADLRRRLADLGAAWFSWLLRPGIVRRTMGAGLGLVAAIGAAGIVWSVTWGGDAGSARAQSDAPLTPSVDEYTVQIGDTLWDICETVVGKGWLWPRIWAFNPEITNPNWIYPGDVVRFYPSGQALPGAADGTPVAGKTGIPAEIASETPDDITEYEGPLVEVVRTKAAPSKPKDRRSRRVYSGLFLTPTELQESGKLTNAAPDKILLSPGDLVYVTFPDETVVSRGDRFMSYRTLRSVPHPKTGKIIGYLTQITSLMTVQIYDGKVARAHVDTATFEVERGQLVTPLLHSPYADIKPLASQGPVDGVVVAVEGLHAQVAGEESFVFVDRGAKHGLQVGNRLAVYTENDPMKPSKRQLPRVKIATLLVVDAKDTASTCLVVNSVREIEAGDPVSAIRTKL